MAASGKKEFASTTASITPSIKANVISYRFATLDDVPQLSALALNTYKQTYSFKLTYYTDDVLEKLFGKSYREDILPRELNDIKFQYIVCTNDSKLIGYAKLEFKTDSTYLDKLYLLNEYQGKGCGHQLLQTCFLSAIAHGYKKMTLNVWDKNEKAIHFYENHGFKRGAVAQFMLFKKIPTTEADMEMSCDDISLQVARPTKLPH